MMMMMMMMMKKEQFTENFALHFLLL